MPCSATNAIIHLKEGLDCKSISQLYMECHAVSHARTRLKGNASINQVLESTVQREQKLSQTSGRLHTTTLLEEVFQQVLHLSTVAGEVPNYTREQGRHLQEKFNQVKKVVRAEQH